MVSSLQLTGLVRAAWHEQIIGGDGWRWATLIVSSMVPRVRLDVLGAESTGHGRPRPLLHSARRNAAVKMVLPPCATCKRIERILLHTACLLLVVLQAAPLHLHGALALCTASAWHLHTSTHPCR
jgi:hypothetical protein